MIDLEESNSFMSGIRRFIDSSKRVFLVAKKPNWEEYWNLFRITGLGILIIGLSGFLIILLVRLFYYPF